LTTIGKYIEMLEEIIEELSEFDEDEELQAVDHVDGQVVFLIGKTAIEKYNKNLN